MITKIRINYRHDQRGHVEDFQAMKDCDDYHVGVYSTDENNCFSDSSCFLDRGM